MMVNSPLLDTDEAITGVKARPELKRRKRVQQPVEASGAGNICLNSAAWLLAHLGAFEGPRGPETSLCL